MSVSITPAEVLAAVPDLGAIGAQMGAGYAQMAGVHAAAAATPSSVDPMALVAHAALHAHHAVAQGMGAEAIAVHELTTLTTGASGAAYAAEDIAGSVGL